MRVGEDPFLHGGGLGERGLRLYRDLLDPDVGYTTSGLAEALGTKSTGGVRRVLLTMESLGLAKRDEDGHWFKIPDVDLDEVAQIVGTKGKAARRERRFEAESTARSEAVEAWSARMRKQAEPQGPTAEGPGRRTRSAPKKTEDPDQPGRGDDGGSSDAVR
jgi:hypothetical protein